MSRANERCILAEIRALVGKLPVYVARDLDRVPNVKPKDMDLFCVARKMEAIEQRLAAVESVNMESVVMKIDNICAHLDGQQSSLKAVADQLDRGVSDLCKSDVIVCRKLKAKNGKTYKTAAFYVTCSAESASLFYDENCWPCGIELRDWFYK